ncbi:LacI family DNA-binding transcriptional regulator [Agromyces sp. Marseille-Q5079]|uniref:LacI family DNA-binding transcriptional regulator n=1 Tax=Agromyces sp. Marseille-Q5079 TaxID=3439059 RepID=UPI003D9CA19F
MAEIFTPSPLPDPHAIAPISHSVPPPIIDEARRADDRTIGPCPQRVETAQDRPSPRHPAASVRALRSVARWRGVRFHAGIRSNRAAGVRDVAALAGVSRQTVSRVLNEHPQIKESTRRRVMDAIAELEYTPNFAGHVPEQRPTPTTPAPPTRGTTGPRRASRRSRAGARGRALRARPTSTPRTSARGSAGIAHLRGQAVTRSVRSSHPHACSRR